jgi:hypothetical protein
MSRNIHFLEVVYGWHPKNESIRKYPQVRLMLIGSFVGLQDASVGIARVSRPSRVALLNHLF